MQTDFGNFLKNDQRRRRGASFSKKMLMEISSSFEPLDEPKKGEFFRKNSPIPFSLFLQKSLIISKKWLK
ncbi:hypothetical protein CH352_06670 [Leptospira hartskeerlii]|uniref:Uncharacterized protein n=1 Tax=Leptospira hartskeerlii TaxID=2023177 RepID=A0A2M9XEZ6_9LEPT|nr:hypothetical protein CH357_07075 [Leptospira hartskeerlii]PJZ34340.1 hypothetical protein CH352_06670 [Leptospira hartskeerlii]